jgi:allantoicase
MTENASPIPSFAVGAINRASTLLGAKGVSVSDDLFAPPHCSIEAAFDIDPVTLIRFAMDAVGGAMRLRLFGNEA